MAALSACGSAPVPSPPPAPSGSHLLWRAHLTNEQFIAGRYEPVNLTSGAFWVSLSMQGETGKGEHRRTVGGLCRRCSPPERDEVRTVSVEGHSVSVYEERPPWDGTESGPGRRPIPLLSLAGSLLMRSTCAPSSPTLPTTPPPSRSSSRQVRGVSTAVPTSALQTGRVRRHDGASPTTKRRTRRPSSSPVATTAPPYAEAQPESTPRRGEQLSHDAGGGTVRVDRAPQSAT